MTALNAAQAFQRAPIERSTATVIDVVRVDMGSVPVHLNSDRARSAGGNEIILELSEEVMVLT